MFFLRAPSKMLSCRIFVFADALMKTVQFPRRLSRSIPSRAVPCASFHGSLRIAHGARHLHRVPRACQ